MNINATLIGQAIWFALFIWFVMKMVWPYFQRIIAERQKEVADGLAAAERGRQTLEISTRQAEEEVKRARERAADIVAQAEKRATQMVDEARGAAREEGSREKAAAQAEIEQQYARAREQLREQVAMLAVAGAEKILRREVDARAHAQLLESIKAQL
ncbi:MAG: F0F1 ATP synthase subunit B [Betaproteobacteria bacterium]|nr:F0F1 ATP synthase subunit B [Betaproteobacteria bacterium]